MTATRAAPFKAGDHVRCRLLPNNSSLVLGGVYVVEACGELAGHWMVCLMPPQNVDLDSASKGKRLWYLASRFV